ncbi:hypothetical protein G6R29_02605 [Fructobacillus sp. M2-14]|uniref:Uncharacterized protein n=2 Tax=Fructobacillus broussonetiae TaxID=2713173 RepID=A0ABS5QZY6_9LACO|nr:hypothetical protein [Fructobacillus broussonetiae]
MSRQHLLGQWRECLAITGAIKKHGEVNHATVNRLNDYSHDHLKLYTELIKQEMQKRGYKTSEKSHQKLIDDIGYDWNRPIEYHENEVGDVTLSDGTELYAGFHDYRYLLQCLYMMQEKADTNQIDQKVWNSMIEDVSRKYPELTELR